MLAGVGKLYFNGICREQPDLRVRHFCRVREASQKRCSARPQRKTAQSREADLGADRCEHLFPAPHNARLGVLAPGCTGAPANV